MTKQANTFETAAAALAGLTLGLFFVAAMINPYIGLTMQGMALLVVGLCSGGGAFVSYVLRRE